MEGISKPACIQQQQVTISDFFFLSRTRVMATYFSIKKKKVTKEVAKNKPTVRACTPRRPSWHVAVRRVGYGHKSRPPRPWTPGSHDPASDQPNTRDSRQDHTRDVASTVPFLVTRSPGAERPRPESSGWWSREIWARSVSLLAAEDKSAGRTGRGRRCRAAVRRGPIVWCRTCGRRPVYTVPPLPATRGGAAVVGRWGRPAPACMCGCYFTSSPTRCAHCS